MDTNDAVEALGALAQRTRLDTFRALIRHEPDGLPAGEVARLLGVPHNTMSTHLAVLARAGLVRAERQGRSIIYRAEPDRIGGLAAFLMTDCCQGNPQVCGPLIEGLANPSPSAPKRAQRAKSNSRRGVAL